MVNTMTNVERVEFMHQHELDLRNAVNEGREITEADRVQFALSDARYRMSLLNAQRLDAEAEADTAPSSLKINSEVKIKR